MNTTVDRGPAEVNFRVSIGNCLPLSVGLKNQDGTRVDLSGYGSELEITWSGGSLTLSTTNSRLTIEQDDDGEDVIVGEITKTEIENMPAAYRKTYEWSVTPPAGCPVTFMAGRIVLV